MEWSERNRSTLFSRNALPAQHDKGPTSVDIRK
jgi:hypothetical protein